MRTLARKLVIGFLLLSLCVLVAVSAWFFRARTQATAPRLPGPAHATELAGQKQWGVLMGSVGPEAAYARFKEQNKGRSFDEQHLAAHLFGAELYRKVGVRGISVCDASFAFGCFHSFFGQAIADMGTGAIAQLDAQCTAALGDGASGCQHGIGHGIMEYYGTNLAAALESCHKTVQKNPLYGCTSGVFMEYNVPIIIDADSVRTEPRPFEVIREYEPCSTIAHDFRQSCYYELPQWWVKYEPDFVKLGKMCGRVPETVYISSCYKGIGNIVGPETDYDVAQIIAHCRSVGTREGMVLCVSTASWGLASISSEKDKAVAVCLPLTTAERTLCAESGIKSQ